MEDLPDALRDVAALAEELRQRGEVAARRPPVGVQVDHPGGVRATARQERRPAGAAHGLLQSRPGVLGH